MLTEKDKQKLSWYQNFVDQQGWPSYEEAKKEVQKIGFSNHKDYLQNRPFHLPSHPEQVYSDEWEEWGVFLGTGNVYSNKKEWPSYEEAKKEAKKFKNKDDYLKNRPFYLPTNPSSIYKNEWKGWGEYLETGRTKNFLEYEEAKKKAQRLGFKHREDYQKNRPSDLPYDAHTVYANEWKGWGEYLGTGNVRTKNFLEYEKAKKKVQKLGFSSQKDYQQNRTPDLPSEPGRIYANKWKGWREFLNTRAGKKFLTYKKAKKKAQKLGFKSKRDYQQNRPFDLPYAPNEIYGYDWEGWEVFLGKV
jgi:hypothetical protein